MCGLVNLFIFELFYHIAIYLDIPIDCEYVCHL